MTTIYIVMVSEESDDFSREDWPVKAYSVRLYAQQAIDRTLVMSQLRHPFNSPAPLYFHLNDFLTPEEMRERDYPEEGGLVKMYYSRLYIKELSYQV